MKLGNYTPGIVDAYDPAKKLARVQIPGVTDGAEVLPQAMLCYPIGDKSEHTDIRILAGDRVWLDFVNGDPRFPIITGFRPKETDGAVDWRRLHHTNLEFVADTDLLLTASGGQVVIEAGSAVSITAPTLEITASVTITGNVSTTGALTNNGINVGSTHTHPFIDNDDGSSLDVTMSPSA